MDKSIDDQKTIDVNGAEDHSVGERPTLRHDVAGTAGRRFLAGDVILGRYRVTDELGQGGMGVVYRCFDETAGIDVALKALPPEVAHNSGEMEEVRENFRLVEKLHHPNIANVKTLEKDPASGEYYLVMECVEGQDLRQWARKRRGEGRPLTTNEIVTVAYRIAEALDYAHRQKVIHRDIKPSNVRVTFDGDVKVLDFGLAAQLHASMSRVSRAYHGMSGTGPYMAPEQWQGRRQGAAADQYALAASVYELLSGAPPFENPDVAVLREAVLNERPEPLAGVPPHVNAALLRGLAKEPGERFADCAAFVAALGWAHAETRRRGGRRAALWLAAAALGYAIYISYRTSDAVSTKRHADPFAGLTAPVSDVTTSPAALSDDEMLALEKGAVPPPRATMTDEEMCQYQMRETNISKPPSTDPAVRFAAMRANPQGAVRLQKLAKEFGTTPDDPAFKKRMTTPLGFRDYITLNRMADTGDKDAANVDETGKPKGMGIGTAELALRAELAGKSDGFLSSAGNLAAKGKPAAGEPWTSPAAGIEFVWVPALKLWVGKYEVTNAEYRKQVPDHYSEDFNGHSLNDDRQPVVYVNFDDAKAYAAWLTEQDNGKLGGLHYRVISEEEWQTCAQCGDGREYPWGNVLPPKYGNYPDSAAKRVFKDTTVIDGYTDGFAVACPVERSGENEWGLYGLGGNVWECCAADVSGSAFGAWRGASWYIYSPLILRCMSRLDIDGSLRIYYDLGFRLVLSR